MSSTCRQPNPMPPSTNDVALPSETFYDWRLDEIVASLRQHRDASLAARQRLGRPVKLPSRRALGDIIDQVCAASFPID